MNHQEVSGGELQSGSGVAGCGGAQGVGDMMGEDEAGSGVGLLPVLGTEVFLMKQVFWKGWCIRATGLLLLAAC